MFLKRVLAGAGSVALTGSVVPLAAQLWWIFDLFTHFRVQLIVGLILLGGVFAARRAFVWCGALAACVALNAAPLVPYLSSAPTDATPTLTVLAVNVQARNPESAGLLEIIAREDPDVVLFTEFTERWAERLAPLASRYPHRYELPRDDAFGIALFSRHPLESAREAGLGTTDAIDARVATPRGTVRIIGVHLRPPFTADWAQERNSELMALAAHIDGNDEPLVVAGDFNMSPYSPYLAGFLAVTGLRDARAEFGLGITWPTFFPLLGIPIDHCLVSDDLGVAQYRRLSAFGSDHYPVLAQLVQD